MTDAKVPEIKIRSGRPMSVWRTQGVPQLSDGTHGYHRANLFLMPITADSGGVAEMFIREACNVDHVKYTGARIDLVHFLGSVRVPSDPWNAAAISSMGLESILTETMESIDKIKENMPEAAAAEPKGE